MTGIWLIVLAGAGLLAYIDSSKIRYSAIFGAAALTGFFMAVLHADPLIQLLCFGGVLTAAFILFGKTENPFRFEPVRESPGVKLIGQLGLVETEIGRYEAGTVSVLKNTWKATDIKHKGIPAGEYVRVKDAKGDKLIVEIAGEPKKDKKEKAQKKTRPTRTERRLHEKTSAGK